MTRNLHQKRLHSKLECKENDVDVLCLKLHHSKERINKNKIKYKKVFFYFENGFKFFIKMNASALAQLRELTSHVQVANKAAVRLAANAARIGTKEDSRELRVATIELASKLVTHLIATGEDIYTFGNNYGTSVSSFYHFSYIYFLLLMLYVHSLRSVLHVPITSVCASHLKRQSKTVKKASQWGPC